VRDDDQLAETLLEPLELRLGDVGARRQLARHLDADRALGPPVPLALDGGGLGRGALVGEAGKVDPAGKLLRVVNDGVDVPKLHLHNTRAEDGLGLREAEAGDEVAATKSRRRARRSSRSMVCLNQFGP
jgi:hypothetical protein